MTDAEKELIALTEKWMLEIRNVSHDYQIAIGKLDTIRKQYESSWWQILLKSLPYLYPIVLLAIIIFFLLKGYSTIQFGSLILKK